MRFYKAQDDWISHLEGEFRREILETLRGFELSRLQRFAPPKIGGLPFGNEPRIASRFLKGESLQLEPSAFSNFYSTRMSSGEAWLYKAFRKNESLPKADWQKIVGNEAFGKWVENKCLWETENGFYCAFTVVSIDGLVFCVDPLNDHGIARSEAYVYTEKPKDPGSYEPFYHTYIGLDSLRMIEWMEREKLPENGRFLDCGTGSGGLLLYFGRNFDEAVGLDINRRAAKLAKFNADLNQIDNVKTICDDAIKRTAEIGQFDLVSWNLPFIFMPDEHSDQFVDGFGGELGIGLCLQFIETLPPLLRSEGLACIAALAPILESGENVLETRLNKLLSEVGLDCTLKVAQVSMAHTKELWDFHRAHKVKSFESVYLFLKHGKGTLKRVGSSAARRVIDKIREAGYRRKYRNQ
jgi:methylase of polypeptide subunit release factors